MANSDPYCVRRFEKKIKVLEEARDESQRREFPMRSVNRRQLSEEELIGYYEHAEMHGLTMKEAHRLLSLFDYDMRRTRFFCEHFAVHDYFVQGDKKVLLYSLKTTSPLPPEPCIVINKDVLRRRLRLLESRNRRRDSSD